MRTTIKTIGENRFIFRKASDFSYTGPKLNSRNAKINAQNQATTRAESLLSQQKQAANVAKQNPLMYDGSTQTTPIEKPADTTYNIDFIETRGGALPFGGKIKSEQIADNGNREYILDNGTRVSASAYDTEAERIFTQVADQQRIKDSLNPLTEIAQRGQQELNPTENMFNDAGVLDMAAVKRLRATGMSDSEIKKRINGLKPSIKETMSNTPNYSPQTQGTTTSATPNVPNTPSATTTPSATVPTTPTTPSAVATTNKTNADTTKMSLAQSVSNLVSSTYGDDPMGQFMQAKLQGDLDLYIDGLVGAAIAKDEEISSAEIQGAAYQKLLDSFYSAHKENNDNLKGILTNVKNDNLKYLEEQKQRDIDKLEWQKQEQIRQGEKQKTQQLLQQSISQALGGRAFSGAGNEQIAATERELDNAIANLAKEYDFKSADIGAQYTQKYTDVNNQFRMDIFNAATQLDQQIETYSLNSFANKKSITDAINKAKGDYAKNVSEIKSGYQKGLSDMVKDINERQKNELDNQFKRDQLLIQIQDKADARLLAAQTRGDTQQAKIETQSSNRMLQELNRINTRINNDPVLKAYNQLKVKFETIDAGYEKTMTALQNGDYASLSLIDQDLVTSLNKMWDENSVVREAEYDRTPNGMSVPEYFKAKVSKLTNGGILSENERTWVKGYIDTMQGVWETQATDALGKFHNQINKTNSQLLPQDWLAPEDFGLPSAYGAQSKPSYNSNQSIMDLLRGNQPVATGGSVLTDYTALGEVTQNYDTPVASREDGGLYDASTVAAWGGKHAGLDIAMKVGTPLPALSDMKVVTVADTTGWGKTVILKDNNGAEHRLSHLSNVNVRKGDTIQKGQVIALSGNTGNSTGPHLDYRIRLNGKYIDPSSYNIS